MKPEGHLFILAQVSMLLCPCAVAHFPRELPLPPPEWVRRGYNLKRWTDFPQGGHFAAAEEPELLAQDIRAFFRPFR
jgi:pimeloyl-ACP methyl ester carboxylesterase